MNRPLVVLGCLLALVVVGGCFAAEPLDDGEPTPEEVFEGAFVHAADLESVAGERTTEVTVGGDRRTERVAVVERPYVEYRSEVLESTESDRVGEIYVSNATTSWWYDPDENEASYYAADEPYDDAEVRQARADEADRQQDLYDLEYRGTETVADRETHVLDVEAKNESVTEGLAVLVGDTEFVYALETVDPTDELEVDEQTIWIDAEYEYPLKERLVVESEVSEDRYVMTERFETVTFDDVDDDRFTFEPPENATVTDLSGS